jgi:hypothetical protein
MTTAMKGPLVIYGQRPPPGTGATGSENPYLAPSMIYGGSGYLDSRAGYNNTKAGCVGFVGSDIWCSTPRRPLCLRSISRPRSLPLLAQSR